MSTYLITGGAGSLGRALVAKLENTRHTVRVVDNSESALAALKNTYPDTRCMYGDIRDMERMRDALDGVDVCIHAAALKNIDVTEYNTPELIKTNVGGTENIIKACAYNSVERLISISSDKAVHPTTAYGTTKLLGEDLMKWAARIGHPSELITFRPGNFWSSNGNVFEVWERQVNDGQPITITDPAMERYFIPLADVARVILDMGLPDGHTIVPSMECFNIAQIAKERYPAAQTKIIGRRPGEKMKEELWTHQEELSGVRRPGYHEFKY